jgi:site-specific recombinase XerD
MQPLALHSPLAEQIRRFINLKRLSGTDYRDQAKLLGYFDRFLVNVGVKQPLITRQITDRYQKSLAHLAPRYRYNRFSVVKLLCEHISQSDPHCYVPEPMRIIEAHDVRCPHIFTTAEIQALLSAASALQPQESLQPQTYRMLLGLLYTTGIRIGEALALDLKDFQVEQKMLCIIAGKFRKDRWIPLHTSACQELESYVHRRLQIGSISPDSPLFLNRRFQRMEYATVNKAFHKLLAQCGIPFGKRSGPCIHSFRHTFAVHRLQGWYQDGEDINARLPWLSTYMGHVKVASTQVYLRATAMLIEQVEQRFHKHFIDNVKPSKGGKP